MKKNQSQALVEVLQPTDAYSTAKQSVDSLPSMKLPAVVRTVEVQSVVVDMLRQVASASKLVEEQRKGVTKHLDAAKKAVNKLFQPLKEHLAELRTDLELKLDEYRQHQLTVAEEEREEIRRKGEAQRKRAERAAATKLAEARSREERKRIQSKLNAKLEVQAAILDNRLDEVDGTPDAEQGVAVIQDVEILELDISQVPEFVMVKVGSTDGGSPPTHLPGDIVDETIMWTRHPVVSNIKKALKAGVEVPGVKYELKTRRAVTAL